MKIKKESIEALIKEAKENGSLVLDLSNRNLNFLPRAIYALKSLIALDLSGNNFMTLPADISELENLCYLNLSENRFQSIPLSVYFLKSLISLDVSKNRLEDKIYLFHMLKNLKSLNLSNNNFSGIEKTTSALKAISQVDLSSNYIKVIPSELFESKALKYLDLSDNKIERFIGSVKESSLEALSLSDNNLESLSQNIINLNNLEAIRLSYNSIPMPPEILENEDANIVFSYYKDNIQVSERLRKQINEAKVLFVGEGGVGKTSLVNRLMGKDFDDDEKITEGVNVSRFIIKGSGEDFPFRMNIWDFGGQEIMHATHQFFLTKRSVYVIVLDSRKGERASALEYWLRITNSFSDNSPIMIVLNKIDESSIELDKRGLKNKYENIVEFYEISCKQDVGIDLFKKRLIESCLSLPYVKDKLDIGWLNVKDELEKLHHDYISFDEFIEISNKNGVSNSRSQKALVSFLHDLGIILHYGNDIRLKDTNILNPSWVTDAVYMIINSNILFQSKGKLWFSDLKSIIGKMYPENKWLYIISIMKKFELCYEFEDVSEPRYLIPGLLPAEEPYFEVPIKDCLRFEIKYKVLPGSVMSRLMVRMHAYILKNTYWRNGVLFRHEENISLVKSDKEEKLVSIYVWGKSKTRRILLGIIRSELNKIHNSIPKIIPTEVIPIPGSSQTKIDYKDLLELENYGIENHFYPKYGDYISVSELLDGVEDRGDRYDMAKDRKKTENVAHNGRLFEKANIGDNATIMIGDYGIQNISNVVNRYDLVSLENALKKVAVEEEDIESLKISIESDAIVVEDTNEIGPSVKSWMKKMLSKAVDGTWQVSIGAAGALLANVIQAYYGWK